MLLALSTRPLLPLLLAPVLTVTALKGLEGELCVIDDVRGGGGLWRCTELTEGGPGRVMMLVGWTRLELLGLETAAAAAAVS